jgi:hypothetical protein
VPTAGWTGPLAACEFDAEDMAADRARAQGMKPTVLLTRKATRAAVLASCARRRRRSPAAASSSSASRPRRPGARRQWRGADKKDETWCLFDGQLIDDELYFELSRFAAGVASSSSPTAATAAA